MWQEVSEFHHCFLNQHVLSMLRVFQQKKDYKQVQTLCISIGLGLTDAFVKI